MTKTKVAPFYLGHGVEMDRNACKMLYKYFLDLMIADGGHFEQAF